MNPDGSIGAYIAVFDGHGGNAVSDWLEKEMYYEVQEQWDNGNAAQKMMDKAFRVADSKLLQPSGFMGMGERGIGGSKCGSTAAIACVYQVSNMHCMWHF
jgi:protein phosphatase 1L